MVVLACAASCYFAACNNALKTYSRARLLDLLETAGRPARFNALLQREDKLTLMTGAFRTLLNLLVVLGVLHVLQSLAPAWPDGLHYLTAFVLAGILVAVFAVAIPVSVARHQPERLLAVSIPLLNLLLVFFLWMAVALHVFDPLVRRLGGSKPTVSDEESISQEVMTVVKDHQENGSVDPAQQQMLEAVFEMPSTAAGEIMTPRTDIKGLDISASAEQVKEFILRVGHSRIPVYEGSLDHILGVLYVKDLIRFVNSDKPFEIKKLLREPLVVPETKPLRELLAEFKARKVHMAIVLDEYGGTAGLVTIEDILEELVGEIEDEYETGDSHPLIQKIDAQTVEVDGRVYVDDLNDEMGFALPEDESYETIAGFVVAKLGHIPEPGETFEFDGLRLAVMQATRTKVTRVRIQYAMEEETTESAE